MASTELIAIVGPTASGKTALAIDIAKRYNGEIICADSRTVYKEMDIGTAKPTAQERSQVPHWGLDLINPNERFSASDFKQYADAAIADITSRGKLPLLVGGTGLYVDSVLYNFEFGPEPNPAERARLNAMTVYELQDYCITNNIKLPENEFNTRHLIRAIELKDVSGIGKSKLSPHKRIVGIATNMSTLRTRIHDRTEHMFENGVVEEAVMLGKKYGWEEQSMTSNIYPLIKKHLDSDVPLGETKMNFSTSDYQLAKRQMTWLRRNPDIMWATAASAKAYIDSLFAS